MAPPPLPAFRRKHVALVRAYAKQHFTDPELRLEDVAIFYDLAERTLREALNLDNTSWRHELKVLRLDRAELLLKTTPYRVSEVARLAGYKSASAFAKAFHERFRLTPREFRRGAGGRARAGGPTGASFRAGRRAGGENVTGRQGTGLTPGERAIRAQQNAEASARVSDMNMLDGGELWPSTEEIESRQGERMRDRADHWRQCRREFQAWVEENDRAAVAGSSATELDPLALAREREV